MPEIQKSTLPRRQTTRPLLGLPIAHGNPADRQSPRLSIGRCAALGAVMSTKCRRTLIREIRSTGMVPE
jgi:hypothetical protein